MAAGAIEFGPVGEVKRQGNDHHRGFGFRRFLSAGGDPLTGSDVVNDPGIGFCRIVGPVFLPDFESELFHLIQRHAGIEAGCFQAEVETFEMISQAKWLMGEGSRRLGDGHAEADRSVKDRDFCFSSGDVFAIEVYQILRHVGSSSLLILIHFIAGEAGRFV